MRRQPDPRPYREANGPPLRPIFCLVPRPPWIQPREDEIGPLLHQPRPKSPRTAPGGELDGAAMREGFLENFAPSLHDRGVGDPNQEFVVDVQTPRVQVQ